MLSCLYWNVIAKGKDLITDAGIQLALRHARVPLLVSTKGKALNEMIGFISMLSLVDRGLAILLVSNSMKYSLDDQIAKRQAVFLLRNLVGCIDQEYVEGVERSSMMLVFYTALRVVPSLPFLLNIEKILYNMVERIGNKNYKTCIFVPARLGTGLAIMFSGMNVVSETDKTGRGRRNSNTE